MITVASHTIRHWTILIEEMRSSDGALYEREFKIVSTDAQGVPMVEHFHSLIEAIEFAEQVDKAYIDTSSAWLIAEKMSADAKTFHWRRSNARA